MSSGTSAQLMQLKESQKLVRLNAYPVKDADPYFNLAITMTNTVAATVGPCTLTGKTALDHPGFENTLFAKLSDQSVIALIARSVLVRIDKTTLDSGVSDSETNLIQSWFPNQEVNIRVGGSPTVTLEDDYFTGDFTATFSGGTIEVKGTFEEERTNLFLTCPNEDDITFTVGAAP